MTTEDCPFSLPWNRVSPPLWWQAAGKHLVGDRHLPDGTRQHLVEGTMPAGMVIAGAQVFGAQDWPQARFSDTPSHLSESK